VSRGFLVGQMRTDATLGGTQCLLAMRRWQLDLQFPIE